MAWRAMNSLLVLRDQVNVIAPNRAKGADGLVGDENHQGTDSDHNPHYVPGVGSDIVTALDLTHDPAGGFDSYAFAEVLRLHRDRRIKYVISNHRIFSSYASGSRAAWTWGSYTGPDPHTNHVHTSVLDDPVSDTTNPWNLEGFAVSSADEYRTYVAAERTNRIRGMVEVYDIAPFTASNGDKFTGFLGEHNLLAEAINALADVVAKLQEDVHKIQDDLANGDSGGGGPQPVAMNVTFTGTALATPAV